MPEAQYDFTEQNNDIRNEINALLSHVKNAYRFAEQESASERYLGGLLNVQTQLRSAFAYADRLPAS
jgi:hypothetical protein